MTECPKPKKVSLPKLKKQSRKDQIKAIKKTLERKAKDMAKERDEHRCLGCGAVENLHSHHWAVHESHSKRLAYEPDNLATLCYTCHIIKVHKRADGIFIASLTDRMKQILGPVRYANLQAVIAMRPTTLSLEDYQAMSMELDARKLYGSSYGIGPDQGRA